MAKKREINIGDKFNRLEIIEILPSKIYGKHSYRMIKCKCDCGSIVELQLGAATTGHTKSCGCYNKEKSITHGLLKKGITSGLGFIYNGIIQRCNNSYNKNYKNYGGRGIKCEWLNIYDFIKDMGDSYQEGLTIDRINVNGNYCKDNCRWITNKEQQRNRTDSIIITYNGITKNLSAWCEELGLKYRTIQGRLERGWDKIDAITLPITSKGFRYEKNTI